MTHMSNTFGVRFLVRRLLKIHTIAFFVIFGVYFVLAFFDPGLLSYDMRQKFRALADDTITLTATVLGSPVQPVVTATADCNATTGVLSVELDWGDDANTYTYDISRDSAPLVSGLTNSLYTDTNVLVGTTYQYEVTGNGPMAPGSATSLPVSVTTPAECVITAAAPAVTIVSFNKKSVDAYDGTPRVSNRRPVFSGTTNMPGATILTTIGTSFVAEFTANSNGYWEWRPPYSVSTGQHIFTVTATDPGDNARQATATLRFDILKPDDTGGASSPTPNKTGSTANTAVGVSLSEVPLGFALALSNEGSAVLQGETFALTLRIDRLVSRYADLTVPIRYSVLDANKSIVFSETHKAVLTPGGVIEQSFALPLYMQPGQYSLQVEILLDSLSVSRTVSFTVKELPLVQLSSGKAISYADLVRNLGWVAFVGVNFVFFWSFLLIREFALLLKGARSITALDLKKAGFIRK